MFIDWLICFVSRDRNNLELFLLVGNMSISLQIQACQKLCFKRNYFPWFSSVSDPGNLGAAKSPPQSFLKYYSWIVVHLRSSHYFKPPQNRGWKEASLSLASLPDWQLSVALELIWDVWGFLNGQSDPACLGMTQSLSKIQLPLRPSRGRVHSYYQVLLGPSLLSLIPLWPLPTNILLPSFSSFHKKIFPFT